MNGDYTRFTFKPKKDYSSVLKQQGRVDLDADFNELMEIMDRRWRSETIDIMGHCIVPNSTPDAFFITPVAVPPPSGDFSIGLGRMYVDGIQIENHGLPPDQYFADLGEMEGTNQVLYSDQPYLPAGVPPPPLTGTPGTTDLIYVDVWQREVTVLGDSALREIALGGPDTATRIQSVWQVRALQDVGVHGCDDPIPAWDVLVVPSAGRLTTSTVPPPASDDPCIISPSGGYRGLENRLYRVEIHAVGSVGGVSPAKFKWSRNNATIASSVTAIPTTTQVTVDLIGRDQVLRFEIGNWIEITDDFREFQGLPGHMAQITAIDEANRILTFAQAIPAGFNFNPADPTRHTRVTRWDQSAGVDANGLLDVVAGPIDIEDGIRVTFALDPTTGHFKIADYWVFAARTADGSVELLQNAPPRGILHHFCRLGFITWGTTVDNTTFTDCRQHWPPAGDCDCCTVTVGDGVDSHGQFTDIQQAINSLGNRGGLVCIGRGFFLVNQTIHLDSTKKNVIIRGMGPATRIAFVPQQGSSNVFMEFSGTEQVRLEDVFVAASNADALVRINGSRFCRVTDCILINVPSTPVIGVATGAAPAPGLSTGAAAGTPAAPRVIDLIENPSNIEIVHNAMLGAKGVASSSGRVTELLVKDNLTRCTQLSVGILQAQGIEVRHNQLRGLPNNAFPKGPGLTRATIDAFQAQVTAVFLGTTASNTFQAAGVLLFSGNRVVISENLITAQVAVFGFLLINTRVQHNDILALIGILSILDLLLKVEDNFVAGLFAGMIQAGFSAFVDCTSNEWIGLNGLIFMSLTELLRAFAAIFAGALSAVGFAGTAADTTSKVFATGSGLAGEPVGFGLLFTAKIHRNDFITFTRGIFKTDAILSADVSIIDNSFMLCSNTAIELGGGGRNTESIARLLTALFNLRHLVQGNAIAIRGIGITTATPLTLIEQNGFQTPSTAIEIDASLCTVKNNFIVGLATDPVDGAGLINLFSSARDTQIAGNQIFDAPGHSILFRQDVRDITIDDNIIRGANQTGIGTFSDAVVVRGMRISRNRIEGCKGNLPAGSKDISGAIAVGHSQSVRFLDNTVADNSPSAIQQWSALFFSNVTDIEIRGNSVTENGTGGNLGTSLGAIMLEFPAGTISVQSNRVRGNGGLALRSFGGQGTVRSLMVQNNHFADGPNRGVFFVALDFADSLVFENNQSIRTLVAGNAFLAGDILLAGTRAVVSGNEVEAGTTPGMSITGQRLVVNGNLVQSPGRPSIQATASATLIVTSNLNNGLNVSAPTLVGANNSLP
jgi:hypothetical protein